MPTDTSSAPLDKQKIILIIGAVVIALAVVAGYFLFKPPSAPVVPEIRSIAEGAAQGTLPSIGDAINPLDNKPDITPTSKTNPFDSVKTNPFE